MDKNGANTRKVGVKGHNPNGEAQHKKGEKKGDWTREQTKNHPKTKQPLLVHQEEKMG